MRAYLLAFSAVTFCTTPAFAMSNDDVRAALEQRFKADRTSACVAAGVIDDGTIATAYYCADPSSQRPYDEHTAFEIGSVTKTMTAALLAEFIVRGEVALNDPIARLLPPGTPVPSFNGREITIGEIVTHTSGLPAIPAQYRPPDMNNPYAAVTERDLLDALAATQLTHEPGSKWEYSNFAMIVLSYALAKRSGKDYETLLRERLLAPLGMSETYVAHRPPNVRLAQGHLPNGMPVVPWDFPPDMAGVGGVRATLPDMLRYLEGELGTRESAITPALARTQEQVASVSGHRMGMNWNLSTRNGHILVSHEGGTGGYSSFAGFDRDAKRAVVLLCDTALTATGGLGSLGSHLLDPSVLVGAPRVVATADAKLIDALVGKYRLQGGLGMELRHNGSGLTIQADGQPEFEMGYDSAGDFYPLKFDALLRPKRKGDGTYTFTWFQLGGALEAERVGPPVAVASKWTPTEAQLEDYVGSYPLMPNFALRIFSTGPKLFVQGTNQRSLELASVERDVFIAESVSAEIDFERVSGPHVPEIRLPLSPKSGLDVNQYSQHPESFLDSLGTRGFLDEIPQSRTFEFFANKLLLNEKARGERGEISVRLWKVTKFYLEHKSWGVLRRFAKTDVGSIQTKHYHQYLDWVQEQDSSLKPATLNHISSTFNKVLKLARQEGAIEAIPATPRTKRNDNPRSFFRFYPLVERDEDEYQLLLRTAKAMAAEAVRVRETIVTEELYDFIIHGALVYATNRERNIRPHPS